MPVLGSRETNGDTNGLGRKLPGAAGTAAGLLRGEVREGEARPGKPGGWLPVCSNPNCASGWLRLWRARQAPVFEGGWLCGPVCARAQIRAAIMREVKGHREPVRVHRHRVPLGLLLLSQGMITRDQLRAALASQRAAGGGRLGQWLRREQGIEERVITRALGAQWGCPVLSLENHVPERVAWLAPRLLVDAFGFLPLRRAGTGLLYIGFEDRIDHCVNLAVERMTGLRVEAGVVDGSLFDSAHRRLLGAGFPPARLVEAATVDSLAATLTRLLEEARPVEARLVRIHDYFWLRMWKHLEPTGPGRPERVEDVLGSLAEAHA